MNPSYFRLKTCNGAKRRDSGHREERTQDFTLVGPEILGRCSGNLGNVVDLTETMILRQKSAENPNIPPFSRQNHAARSKIEFRSTERRESRILPHQDHKFRSGMKDTLLEL